MSFSSIKQNVVGLFLLLQLQRTQTVVEVASYVTLLSVA